MFYLGVLASKKIADETRKFVKERARNREGEKSEVAAAMRTSEAALDP